MHTAEEVRKWIVENRESLEDQAESMKGLIDADEVHFDEFAVGAWLGTVLTQQGLPLHIVLQYGERLDAKDIDKRIEQAVKEVNGFLLIECNAPPIPNWDFPEYEGLPICDDCCPHQEKDILRGFTPACTLDNCEPGMDHSGELCSHSIRRLRLERDKAVSELDMLKRKEDSAS